MSCINKNLPEFQTLLKRSGISESLLAARCSWFVEEFGRFPHLDELENADSTNAIKEHLNIKSDATIENEKLLNTFLVPSIEEANSIVNDLYRDKEVYIFPLGNTSIVNVQTRPSRFSQSAIEEIPLVPRRINSQTLFHTIFNKLQKLYGINVNRINTLDLYSNPKFLGIIKDGPGVKGFILDGLIYINTDLATADTKIHEMLHLLVGSMRFSNPSTYVLLLDTVMKTPEGRFLASKYKNRTQNDVAEEVLVTELSKSFAGMGSFFDSMSDILQYEVIYNITRVLDSCLMGTISVNALSPTLMLNSNLKILANAVESTALNQITVSSLNDAEVHRILLNTKSDLLKNNKLREECL